MRAISAILAILLVVETTASAGKPCCCLRRFAERAAVVHSPGAKAPPPCCSHAPASADGTRSRLPRREPGCPCRTIEPYVVEAALVLPALDAPAGALLPAPELATAFPASVPRDPRAPCGTSPPGSDAGPPSSATPALLPTLTI